MTSPCRPRFALVAALVASAVSGCGKRAEDESRVPPAPVQQAAEAPRPVPGPPPGAVGGSAGVTGIDTKPAEKVQPPEPQTPQVTLDEVLARDAEKWAAGADAREAARAKLAESESKLAVALRTRVPKGEKLPPYVVGEVNLYRKTEEGQSFGYFQSLSPDGGRIAVEEASLKGGTDRNSWYRVVDLVSGGEACRFDAGPRFAGPRAFSPDGSVFAIGTIDKGMGLWDAKTGELRHHVPNKLTWDLTPDATGTGWVASLGGSLVRLDGGAAVVKTYCPPAVHASKVAVSPSGSLIAAYSYSSAKGRGDCVSLWDWATGARLAELDLPAGRSGNKLFFSPDSRTVYSHQSDTIVAFDLPARTARTVVQAKQVSNPTLSPDGRLLAYYSNPELVLRDLGSGSERRLRSPFSPDSHPVFFPGGTLLATTANSHFVVWDVALSRP